MGDAVGGAVVDAIEVGEEGGLLWQLTVSVAPRNSPPPAGERTNPHQER